MLNRAAFFATLIAGSCLGVAVLAAQAAPSATEPQAQVMPVEVLDHAPVGWFLTHEGDEARLAYGVADTDQVLVMLACTAGSASVHVFGLASPEDETVRLVSASQVSSVSAPIAVDPLTGATVIEGHLPTQAEALQGFRQTGRLSLTLGDGPAVPAHAVQAELPQVRAFFDHCEQRSI